MLKENLQIRLTEAGIFFTGEKYKTSLSLASHLFEQNRLAACKVILDNLPTKDELLETLVAKLKGKSIYKTLRRIHENKDVDSLTKVKGLSSLVTHCVIEMQAGGTEYGMLLPILLEKEEELISELSLAAIPVAKKLAKAINQLQQEMSMVPFDRRELTVAIDNLTDSAREALADAVKDKDVNIIFNILGMKQITSFKK
jgi:hypothetical protein